jgi:tRNA modification GTPase
LDGRLSKQVSALRHKLLAVLAYLTATIDFTEQEVPAQDIGPDLLALRDGLQVLLRDADQGIVYRQGARVAIIGQPNAGKSSLFNALLRTNRAIVTAVPGTTRDTVEETVNLRGVPVVLVDTAGLNDQADDLVERLGVERSRAAVRQADLVLWVIDGSRALSSADRALVGKLTHRPVLIALNKADLPCAARVADLLPCVPVVQLSALTGVGLADLEEELLRLILGGKVLAADSPAVNNLRHQQALQCALDHVQAAVSAHQQGWPADLLTIDLTTAGNALGEITGESVSEDLLQTIFSQFCIGK